MGLPSVFVVRTVSTTPLEGYFTRLPRHHSIHRRRRGRRDSTGEDRESCESSLSVTTDRGSTLHQLVVLSVNRVPSGVYRRHTSEEGVGVCTSKHRENDRRRPYDGEVHLSSSPG